MSGLLLASAPGIGWAPKALPAAPRPLRRLFLSGGGTGGHVNAGLAVVECARESFPGLDVVFFRTRRAIEDRVFAGALDGLALRGLDLSAPGPSPLALLRFAFQCLKAQAEIRREIRRDRPDALLALGGYPCLPGIIAARREGVPLVLLEQNSSPGKVVRLCVRWADAVACPDIRARDLLGGARRAPRAVIAVTGNPVRLSVLRAARRRLELRAAGDVPPPRRRTVLVVGGSQGARGLNRAVLEALPAIRHLVDRIAWIHITGNADKEAMEQAYRKDGWNARVFDFTGELPDLLAQSDLAITRAGGTIVAELSAIGVPSVLVPYPHHRDQHQLHNAASLVDAGAARLIPEDCLGPETLARLLEEVASGGEGLRAMEQAALGAARPGAARAVVDLVQRFAGGS